MSLKWISVRRGAGGAAVGLVLLAAACVPGGASTTSSGRACKPARSPALTLAAYSTPYDAYGKLISTWQKEWAAAHNKQQVIFQTSFGGSTTQAQNVASGFPADIVALSLVPDVQIVQKAGLITHDWAKDPEGGIVATTPVALDVRPGNPKHISDWNDLTRPGLKVLTPDPAQSGGAKWNIVAAYGASMRGRVPGYAAGSRGAAQRLLTGIFKNVTVMDKSANDSLKNFESGNGDVAISYENQVMLAKAADSADQLVIPPSTVLVQSPAVVVDKNAQKHCVLPIANAFVSWLHTPEAQRIFQEAGYFRPIDLARARQGNQKLGQRPLADVFSTGQVGGWDQLLNNTVFGSGGVFTRAFKAAKG